MISRVLRLKFESGLSYRQIAEALGVSTGTVTNYLSAASRAGLPWPLPDEFDEVALLRAVSSAPGAASPATAPMPTTKAESPSSVAPGSAVPVNGVPIVSGEISAVAAATTQFAPIDFQNIRRELSRKGVTRQLLWEEYCERCAGGSLAAYGYTQFCVLYQRWNKRLSLSMRQHHLAGDKLFVDYCGPTIPVTLAPGKIAEAQVFVAVLGASSYTYAEATWTQGSEDWIASHVAAFAFFGGAPNLVVPDNLKSGVQQACRYEPLLNESYAAMLEHYGATALPARPYKPRDKAKVEVGVQVVERWILARLRHRIFFSLAELNGAIGELLEGLNTKPFKKLEGSRLSHFQTLDRPALKPLPLAAYEYARLKKARVHLDYHVEIEGHFYSVPHALAKRQVEVRITNRVVEFLHGGKRVACHPRSLQRGGQSTVTEHMPRAHQAHREWSPPRFLDWARRIGPHTHFLVDHLLAAKPHPEQGFRSCIGLLSLARHYGNTRLEAACAKARSQNAFTRASVNSLLKNGLDSFEPASDQPELPLPPHQNVRGAAYYR